MSRNICHRPPPNDVLPNDALPSAVTPDNTTPIAVVRSSLSHASFGIDRLWSLGSSYVQSSVTASELY
ncbi:hypothetical protein NL676_023500 [Syzygium grande]|nr:hypothetical protein NL676_023500 [Syzygium grande]